MQHSLHVSAFYAQSAVTYDWHAARRNCDKYLAFHYAALAGAFKREED